MSKFLHTGDEHLDADTHGWVNPATGLNTLWESNYRVVRFLAETAVENKVDFFLSAGDNFKTGRPSQEALLMFADALGPVAEAGIPIVLLDGNHHITGVASDHRTVIHVLADMLRSRGATVFIASKPALIRLPDGTQIAALPWLSKNRVLAQLDQTDLSPAAGDLRVSEFAVAELERMVNEADLSAPLIMASHITVDSMRIDAVQDGFTRGSETELAHLFSEPILPLGNVREMPFQYGALSHIHTPQKAGGNFWYAGSPNRLTFTDMNDEKAGNLVTLTADGPSVERIITPARKMARIDLETGDPQSEIAALTEGTLVQAILPTGATSIAPEMRKAITDRGAVLSDTKARPKPREIREPLNIPDKNDHLAALRLWAERHPVTGISIDQLVTAATSLEA